MEAGPVSIPTINELMRVLFYCLPLQEWLFLTILKQAASPHWYELITVIVIYFPYSK